MLRDLLVRSLAAATAARVGGLAIDPAVEEFTTAAEGLGQQERLCHNVPDADSVRILFWQTPCALIVGRTDTRLPSFNIAAERLAAEGWPVVVRRSGGTACPVSPGTLQFALCRVAPAGFAIDAAYREFATTIRDAVASIGLTATVGEVSEAFCPGRFDIQIDGRKIAGLSQHWRESNGRRIVTTAASLIFDGDPQEFSRVVDLFHECAGGKKRCRAEAITSIALAFSGPAPHQKGVGRLPASLSV